MMKNRSTELCLVLFGVLTLTATANSTLNPVLGEAASIPSMEEFEGQSDVYYTQLLQALNLLTNLNCKP